MMSDRSTLALSFTAILAGACIATPAHAGDWKTRYGVSVSEQYSDNICLDDSGDEDEWISTVTPSFGLSGTGGRAKFDVKAAFEINSLDDNDSRCAESTGGQDSAEGINPRVDASGTIEVWSNTAFIDLTTQVRQNSSNSFTGGGDSSLNRGGNKNTTYDYSINPYIVGKIKDLAKINLGYTYDNQKNSADELENSAQQTVNLVVSSVPGASPLGWALVGNYEVVDYAGNDNANSDRQELSSVALRLNYGLSRKWQFYASTGEDFNDFQSSSDDIDGTRWDAGFTWTPNPRTQLQLGTGDQFIGTTPFLDFSYRRKRSVLTASYKKSLTFSRSLRSRDIEAPITDANGNPLLDIDGLPVFLSFSTTSETRSPIVDERMQLGYRWSKGRTSFNADLVESTQIREEDDRSSKFSTVSLSASREISPKLSLNTRIVYRESEVDEDSSALGDESKEYRLYLGARRKLGAKTSMTLNYSHNDRRSDQAEDEYRENRLSLGLVMTW